MYTIGASTLVKRTNALNKVVLMRVLELDKEVKELQEEIEKCHSEVEEYKHREEIFTEWIISGEWINGKE